MARAPRQDLVRGARARSESSDLVGELGDARDQQPLAAGALDDAHDADHHEEQPDDREDDDQHAADAGDHAEDEVHHPDHDLRDQQHDAVLGVPLHLLVLLLGEEGHEGQQPQVGQHDHDVAVGRHRPTCTRRWRWCHRRRWGWGRHEGGGAPGDSCIA